jgi:hypothetical protein
VLSAVIFTGNFRALLVSGKKFTYLKSEAKQSFPALRSLQIYLQSSMNEERLNHLAVMHVNQDFNLDIVD